MIVLRHTTHENNPSSMKHRCSSIQQIAFDREFGELKWNAWLGLLSDGVCVRHNEMTKLTGKAACRVVAIVLHSYIDGMRPLDFPQILRYCDETLELVRESSIQEKGWLNSMFHCSSV